MLSPLFSSEDKDILNLMTYLHLNGSGTYFYTEITETTFLTSSRVKNLLPKIEEFYHTEMSEKKLEVHQIRGGIVAKFSKDFNPTQINRTLASQTLGFEVLEYFLAGKHSTYEELAEKLNISKGTLQREIADLNTVVKEYDISFQGANRVIGSEGDIRFCLFSIYWQHFEEGYWQFTCFPEENAEKLVESFFPNELEPDIIDKLKIWIAIICTRILNKQFLTEPTLVIEYPFMKFDEFKQQILASTNFLSLLPKVVFENELSSFYEVFSGFHAVTYDGAQTFEENCDKPLDYYQNELSEVFIPTFEKHFGFSLSNSENWYFTVNLSLELAFLSNHPGTISSFGQFGANSNFRVQNPVHYKLFYDFQEELVRLHPESFFEKYLDDEKLSYRLGTLVSEVLARHRVPVKIFANSKSRPQRRAMFERMIRENLPYDFEFADRLSRDVQFVIGDDSLVATGVLNIPQYIINVYPDSRDWAALHNLLGPIALKTFK